MKKNIHNKVTGQIQNFEINAHLNQRIPGEPHITISLTSKLDNSRYECQYSVQTLPGNMRQPEKVEEVYNRLYETIVNKSRLLKIEDEGRVVKIGLMDPDTRQIYYQ